MLSCNIVLCYKSAVKKWTKILILSFLDLVYYFFCSYCSSKTHSCQNKQASSFSFLEKKAGFECREACLAR